MTDPRGHLYGRAHEPPIASDTLATIATEPDSRRRALAALLAVNPDWLYALELFNGGFYWEAHEAWERFWHCLGRTTAEARLVQGLVHMAAACVKIREGKPVGVGRHTQRTRELLGDVGAAGLGDTATHASDALGMDHESIAGVLQELEHHRPECWHTSRTPVVRVLAAELRLMG